MKATQAATMLGLLLVGATIPWCSAADPAPSGSQFEAPVRLMVDGKPLNQTAKQMYPSPAMFDVDSDGQLELVVGDIFGAINIYENTSKSGKGDPVWGGPARLKSTSGKPIKVSNW